ncbi:MAG: hypothetical protein GY864_00200 [Desulfobacterales bacterium]|nr:hypothetical protein [Desulfobacterales bacterium]
MSRMTPTDILLVADSYGQILYKRNEKKKCIPASTLKLLTALSAIHHLGISYKFKTEFYISPGQDLKIKGFGDPLLISEAWHEIADVLAGKIRSYKNLILDDTFFSRDIKIPSVGKSSNPYDAPVGALCANFNTVFFDHDEQGRIISAEPQTPLIPFVREKIRAMGPKKGRYALAHDGREIAFYAGELLAYLLREKGVKNHGKTFLGQIGPEDRLLYTYYSGFPLEIILKKMMTFSNNFIANQIVIALGAHIHGPPGTLANGINVMSDYARKELYIKDIEFAEGSGISRENRISALDMLAILKRFKPYRHMLRKKGDVFFKTGTLKGIRTRAGYMESTSEGPWYLFISLDRAGPDMDLLMECLERTL